ncbi:MAG: bifunctional deaminase-reductase domain protein [Frankiales bacterium]|jgi:riboflavin-specific deaminase-like protein|nr:bifunctional deaminase-reductase domain protein [Frankiales bacterium]
MQLQRIFPGSGDVDIAEVYGGSLAPPHADRPHVTVNMVASVDGKTAIDGRSGGLSSPPDKAIFRLLRSLADVVLVGAGTVRAESYGTVKADDDVRAQRAARGQSPVAALAIVSRSVDLDWTSPVFTQPTHRPFVLAPADAPASALRAAEKVATVIAAGNGGVDLAAALRRLRHDHGVTSVLCEGGPTLNGQLAAGRLLDQLCVTVSPAVVGGDSKTILGAVDLPAPLDLSLASALLAGSELFLRYRLDGLMRTPSSSNGT